MLKKLRNPNSGREDVGETITLRAFLEAFVEPALVIQYPDRQIVGVNRALKRTFGYDERTLVGQSTRILHASDETYEFIARLGDLSGVVKSAFQTRYWLKRRDGKIVATENHITPVSIGGADMFLSLIHVTDDPAWLGVLDGVQSLTLRERDIVACLLAGMSGKEVARTVGISPRTVEKHRDRILEKFSVTSTGQLLARFLPSDIPAIDVTLRSG